MEEKCTPIKESPTKQSPTKHSPTKKSPSKHSPTKHSPSKRSPTKDFPRTIKELSIECKRKKIKTKASWKRDDYVRNCVDTPGKDVVQKRKNVQTEITELEHVKYIGGPVEAYLLRRKDQQFLLFNDKTHDKDCELYCAGKQSIAITQLSLMIKSKMTDCLDVFLETIIGSERANSYCDNTRGSIGNVSNELLAMGDPRIRVHGTDGRGYKPFENL